MLKPLVMFQKGALYCTALLLSTFLYADEVFFQWHTTNIQLLRGSDYEIGSDRRTIMTLEHANGWRYGDFYMFVDQAWLDNGKPEYYTEPTLRLSLSKITGKDFSYGIIKDVLISGQLEKPKGLDMTHLAGFAVDLNLSGFKFFKTNFFIRDNSNLAGNTYQATFIWNRPFKIGNTHCLIEGFADLSGGEDFKKSNQLIVPRFLVDIGDAIGGEKNKLWMGMEYQYWHNKFGTDGITESVPQAQVKYVF